MTPFFVSGLAPFFLTIYQIPHNWLEWQVPWSTGFYSLSSNIHSIFNMELSAYIVALKFILYCKFETQDMYRQLSCSETNDGWEKERFTCFNYILISLVSPFKIFSQGANFADVIQMTDIFEGSIIRSARRLDEFLNQVCEYPPSRK